jgi:mannose-6-phosphate isomerase-like protein (cupin superfamily)
MEARAMITLNVEKQGERITFLAEADSAAPVAEAEILLAPGASGPPPHIHTRQRETFHVQSGRLIAIVDGRERTLEAGETVVVEAGQVHTFANTSPTEPVAFHGTVEPALHFQWFLGEMARAAIRAGGSWKDVPLLEVAYILHQVRSEYRLAGMPILVQDLLFGLLARAAVLLGKTKEIAAKDVEAAATATA